MLSSDVIAKMSREELVEHVHRIQEAAIACGSEVPVEERCARPALPQIQQQLPISRQQRRNSRWMNAHVFGEGAFSPHGSTPNFRRAWRVGEDSGFAPTARFPSTSQEEVSSGNVHNRGATSLTSVISEIAATQVGTLPDALPVTSTGFFSGQASRDVHSFSASTNSMAMQRPAKWTEKLSVGRSEEGAKYLNHYQIIRELGRGTCGKVQLAYDMENCMLVAIKQVRRADSKLRIGGQTNAQMQFSALQREIAVMKKLRHKNIVPLYEVIDDPNAKKLYLVMMYVDNGPIGRVHFPPEATAHSQVCPPIPKDELAWYARQLLAGLEYLHKHKIVHRDIKPENILVDRNKHAFLADFGVSEVFDASNRERMEALMQESLMTSRASSGGTQHGQGIPIQGTKGTMLFVAPELWRGDSSYARPVDMWALGVTLYILLTGLLPFWTLDDIMNPALPAIPTSYGSKWAELLQGLLDRDPSKRITVRAARAIVKSMNEEDYNPYNNNDNERHSPTNITEADLATALTPAQYQKDQDDMEWLLGQHADKSCGTPDRRFSKGIMDMDDGACGYGMPFSVCSSGNTSSLNVAIEAMKGAENVDGAKNAHDQLFVRVHSPFLPSEKASPQENVLSLPDGGCFSPKELLLFPDGGKKHVGPTGKETSSSTLGSAPPAANPNQKAVTRRKGKCGFLAVLREALSFARSKKSRA